MAVHLIIYSVCALVCQVRQAPGPTEGGVGQDCREGGADQGHDPGEAVHTEGSREGQTAGTSTPTP